MIPVKHSVLEWLLEEENQPVRFLTLRHLLKMQSSDERLITAKYNIRNYSPINEILDHRMDFLPGPSQKYKPYQKYHGLYWQIIFLGDFLATAEDKRVQECCEAVITLRQKSGGYVPGENSYREIACLTGNILRALIIMGFAEYPNVHKGLEHLAQRIVDHRGVPCYVMDYSIYDNCYMTVPRVLRTFNAVPVHRLTDTIRNAVKILVEQEYESRIYRYVHSNAHQFHEAFVAFTNNRKKRTTIDVRQQFNNDFRVNNPGIPGQEKTGWKRFAFPLSYNTNLLEAVVALIEAGDIRKRELSEAVQVILKQKQKNDTWNMNGGLNGKMIADIEEKNKPSKWITFYSLYVLDNIEGVEFS